MPNTTENYVTREQLEIAFGRLENKMDAHFNAIDAKFNNQRLLLLGIALGVIAQIINAWILHLK